MANILKAEADNKALLLNDNLSAISNDNKHIVDQMIEERASGFTKLKAWPLIRMALYPLLGYKRAVKMADTCRSMSGTQTLDHLQDLLKLNIKVTGLENIPENGACILAPNHPTGIADGIAIYQTIKQKREDLAIFTNRDAIRVNPNLLGRLIPVEWREGHRTPSKMKETLRQSTRAFKDGRSILLFPSGRIAFWHKEDQCLTERPWMSSIVTMAKKHEVPVIPVHMKARNSGLFYLFSRISSELRDMTVFYELLNKTGAEFEITFGSPISHSALEGDVQAITDDLQHFVTDTLAKDANARFIQQ